MRMRTAALPPTRRPERRPASDTIDRTPRSGWRSRARRTACLLALCALGPGVVAAASPVPASGVPASGAGRHAVWGPVHRFERNPRGASMAVDGHGVVTVAWGSTRSWPHRVTVARRTPAGTWQAPVTVGQGDDPVVAVDARGTVTVAWTRERRGVTTGVWAVRKIPGRPWGTPVHLSADRAAPGYPDGGDVRGASDLALAAGPGGRTLVAWAWANRDDARVQAAFRPDGGPWRRAVDLTPASGARHPRVAFAPRGRAWVAFDRAPERGPSVVKVRRRLLDGSWSPTTRVGTGQLGGLGTSRYAEVTVAFLQAGAVRTALWSPVAGWQAPTPATPSDARVQDWAFASNRRGAALVVYTRPHGRVDAVRRTDHGAWRGPVTLAASGSNAFPAAALDPGGDMVAAWGTYGLWAAYRPAGRGWEPVTTVQPDTGGVDVLEATAALLAPGGDAVLLWDQEARPLRARVMHHD